MAAAVREALPLGLLKSARLSAGQRVSLHSLDQVGPIELIHGEPPGAHARVASMQGWPVGGPINPGSLLPCQR